MTSLPNITISRTIDKNKNYIVIPFLLSDLKKTNLLNILLSQILNIFIYYVLYEDNKNLLNNLYTKLENLSFDDYENMKLFGENFLRKNC